MEKVHNTVFISYAPTNHYHARAIAMDLHQHGYEVFLDFEEEDSDLSDSLYIRGRAHYLAIVTPSALSKGAKYQDYHTEERFLGKLRIAVNHKQNVILMPVGFNEKTMRRFLTIRELNNYPHYVLEIDAITFDKTMQWLRSDILSTPIDVSIFSMPNEAIIARRRIAELVALPAVTKEQLLACQYFEQANVEITYDNYPQAIDAYIEAIKLNSDFVECYNERASIHDFSGYFDKAIADYSEAIRINSNYVSAYYGRACSYISKEEYDTALMDFNQAIRLAPCDKNIYVDRGLCYFKKGDFDQAIGLPPIKWSKGFPNRIK